MAKRIAQTTLNASTIDILNVIRQNASYEYQNNVPVVTKATDIPKVGEVIYGTPAFANQFINALVNRIALVLVQSATFNNPYASLKKGYLEFGETVEDIFVSIAKAVEFSAEKAKAREFQRTFPDVRSAFHTMNWRVMYPVTVQEEDLTTAFLSMEGVQNLITKIINSVYEGAQYDEFLLFKYMLIKACNRGNLEPVSVGDSTDLKDSAVEFRAMYNLLPFMSADHNEAGVLTTTPKENVRIFMSARFNAMYDVNILASAFNMDKATFEGKLHLIDDWSTFDNDRFAVIRENSDGLEEVTATELMHMDDVVAIMVDENWFQVYDNKNKFTEQYVASGLYWNYFYHTWKTVSHSPFSNGVVFLKTPASVPLLPNTFTAKIASKDESADAVVFTLDTVVGDGYPSDVHYVQTDAMVDSGIAIQKYGAVIIPASKKSTNIKLVAELGGATYEAGTNITGASATGVTVTMTKK